MKSRLQELKEEKIRLEIEALKKSKQGSSSNALVKAVGLIFIAFMGEYVLSFMGHFLMGMAFFWLVIGYGSYLLALRLGLGG